MIPKDTLLRTLRKEQQQIEKKIKRIEAYDTPDTAEEYVQQAHNYETVRCPRCGNSNIHPSHIKPEDKSNYVVWTCICGDCDRRWKNKYSLVDMEILD